jgi:hypothetical protein
MNTMKLNLTNDLVFTVCQQCATDLYSYRLTRINHLHDPRRSTLGEYDRQRGERARDAIRSLLRSAPSRDDRLALHVYIRELFRIAREKGNLPARWQDQTLRVLHAHPQDVPARTMNALHASIAAGTWTPPATSAPAAA